MYNQWVLLKIIHNQTSTQMFIKKNPTHRINEKKIDSQSTVVHCCLMKTKNQSPTPFQDKAGIFKTVLCGYSQFYLIWFVQSSHLLTLHPYMKTYIKWEVSKCSIFIFIFLVMSQSNWLIVKTK